MDKMKIEIWSDIACPYCYIGKRKLEAALGQFANKNRVELVWHSYELDPKLPKKAIGKPFVTYFTESHGMTVEQVNSHTEQVTALAKEVGLDFDFDKLVVANTSDALRLVKLANESNLATKAEEVLFKAHLVEGKDISDRGVLLQLGTQIGLQESDIVAMLDSDRFVGDIAKDIKYSETELKLEYIPFYLFNNKHMIEGSLAPEKYLEVLTKAFSEWEQYGVSADRGTDVVSGQSCSIDGVCS